MTDPICDMLNRIKNAQAVDYKTVEIPYSKIKFEIAKLLEKEGLIDGVEKYGRTSQKVIKIELKYENRDAFINGARRLSKPGQRLYSVHSDIPHVRYGRGVVIISTSRGLMTDRDARRKKVGGELLLEIW
jgi:small subunit ribosomal protein S8